MLAKSYNSYSTPSTKNTSLEENHHQKEIIKLFQNLSNFCWSYKYFEKWFPEFLAKSTFESIAEINTFYENYPEELYNIINNLENASTEFFSPNIDWQLLQKKIVELDNLKSSAPIRIWVLGANQGESVYSLSILLEKLKLKKEYQLFGTDQLLGNIKIARSATYSSEQIKNVEKKDIDRFFESKNGMYSIANKVKSKIFFSNHCPIKNPPYNNMDLVICQGIHHQIDLKHHGLMNRSIHFSLRKEGLLFLSKDGYHRSLKNCGLKADDITPNHIFINHKKISVISYKISDYRFYMNHSATTAINFKDLDETKGSNLYEVTLDIPSKSVRENVSNQAKLKDINYQVFSKLLNEYNELIYTSFVSLSKIGSNEILIRNIKLNNLFFPISFKVQNKRNSTNQNSFYLKIMIN
ncbi:CheR family methyltransferase [Sediminitomix flava]|uniref:Chemotaxis methyl-accepting protein methylase n=1 Tax=Sediminitomix flava TaxID=379075 RepID=A0A315Z5D9_SEDFL|nr:CheR family methyltransferase [Sediminitomix flava]PWJ38419.1 chemotaxis methyl-accepting protein methylase [Sediminitomix flava]